MPIYAYRCAACGHAKDVLQKVSDPVLTVCPACGAAAFEKQVTAAGFQLKGSGWYVTDFRDGGKAAAGGNGEAGKANGAPKTDGTGKSGGASAGSADAGGSASTSGPAPAAVASAPAASSGAPDAGAK